MGAPGTGTAGVLADLTWPRAGRAAEAGAVLAVPLGSTEQHGPHLPLSTDTDVAVALCGGLADARADVLVAPALPYGSSGEHAGFAGTLSIGAEALRTVVLELGRSAADTFAHVIFVSGHGGNAQPAREAVDRLTYEGRDASLFLPHWSGDAHAGRTETSLQLVLHPARVSSSDAEAGATAPLASMMPALRAGGVRAVAPNGVLGDPAGASAHEGAAVLAQLVADLVAHVEAWLGRSDDRERGVRA